MRYTIMILIMLVNTWGYTHVYGVEDQIKPVEEHRQVVVVNRGEVMTKVINVEATAYCPCERCCGKSDGITASGTKAKPNHTIAADKSIPFGTKVKINGTIYTVEDRGGAINEGKIDIFFSSHQEAIIWGRRTVEMEVLR